MTADPDSAAQHHRQMAGALRALSFDAVQQARSGHPGMPMGMADIAVALWGRHLDHNPTDPAWPNRDRFVLSNGHGSMLLYGLLHLTGYNLPIDELKRFRQLHSKTPGHPEVGVTPGVETTTGPLGQGLANAVGMALAERMLAGQFNREGHDVIDHLTYVFLGDGCLMEGISHEVCSLAGTWHLSRLVALYDDNGISIDGETRHWFADDTAARFQAYGWHVIPDVDGHDVWAVDQAIAMAREWARSGRDGVFAPTLIMCRTQIGRGSPNRAGTAKAHGEPLGDEEIALTREAIDWPHPPFEVPVAVRQLWDGTRRGGQLQSAWNERLDAYRRAYPELAAELERRLQGRLGGDIDDALDAAIAFATAQADNIATRKASLNALNQFGPRLPELVGGSADLTGSNLTNFAGSGALRAGENGQLQLGRHINFGVREFGMAAIANGMALHGGLIPYVGTFLTFSDYSRNALRMAALMNLRVIHVFTHDSIGLGEDGPTHQAIEHAATLRLIPGLDVWRPGDAVETAVAWFNVLSRQDGPGALLLTRQNVDALSRSDAQVDAIHKGGYVLRDAHEAKAVIIATGSEVGIAMAARELLAERHDVAVRVVSMPCTNLFDRQDVTYKSNVLPDNLPRIAIESGVSDFWWKYGCAAVVGLDRFGESAPAGQLFKLFGFTPENLVDTVLEALRRTTQD
ncbi:MAG: transketolase [Burkholderiaceae bacterium]